MFMVFIHRMQMSMEEVNSDFRNKTKKKKTIGFYKEIKEI
jgi:hypothetical protein